MVTPKGVLIALAHWVLEPIRLLLKRGAPITPAIAASFGRTAELVKLLASATTQERQDAFGLAVINRQVEAARACLDAAFGPLGFDAVIALVVPDNERSLHVVSRLGMVPDGRRHAYGREHLVFRQNATRDYAEVLDRVQDHRGRRPGERKVPLA